MQNEHVLLYNILYHIQPGGNSYNLCLEEKLAMLKSNRDKTLNKHSELCTKCRHRNSFRVQDFKQASALNMERVISKSLVYDVIL